MYISYGGYNMGDDGKRGKRIRRKDIGIKYGIWHKKQGTVRNREDKKEKNIL